MKRNRFTCKDLRGQLSGDRPTYWTRAGPATTLAVPTGRPSVPAVTRSTAEPLPHAATRLPDWRAARADRGRLLVALDFDGTLAPIVPHPEDAALDPAVRHALAGLAARPDTDVALVSGRALADLRNRVRLVDAFYAGNHGLEIAGPGVDRVHDGAAAARPRLAARLASLAPRLRDLDGVQIEDKGLSASIHFRRADPAVEGELERRIAEAVRDEPSIRVTRGKKVIELRPAVAWHKGAALDFLIRTLEGGPEAGVPALFIGDDATDEDAFEVLRDQRGGVVVGDPPPADTAAAAYLGSVAEVASLLEALAADFP
jgi:trehalose 6-phosphate phosphatase